LLRKYIPILSVGMRRGMRKNPYFLSPVSINALDIKTGLFWEFKKINTWI